MKFIFIAEDEDFKNKLEFSEETWTEVLPRVLDFLRGCGFVIDAHATLDIVMPDQFYHSDEDVE